MKKLIILILLMLGMVSILCSSLKNIPDDVELYESYQYHGNFDHYTVIRGGFMKGNMCQIFTNIHDTITIWGKDCKFNQGEGVYSYGELWSSHEGCYCKYFVINSNRTLKYSISR